MKRIYFDNAATSFPKAPGVPEAVYTYLSSIGSSVNRSQYPEAMEAEETVYETREMLCSLFSCPNPENVVFTKNITESLNLLIKGLLKPNDHVLITSMEHNAIVRPLYHLKEKFQGQLGIGVLPCNQQGELPTGQDLEQLLQSSITPQTKAVILTHASNVCGTIMPIKEIGDFCKRYSLYFLLDTAQTAGVLHIDFERNYIDALAFTGHKSLLGPQGIGGVILSERLSSTLEPLITGGTGSSSEGVFQPVYMPDRFEGGTLNIPGIYGLHTSLKYLHQKGLETIKEHQDMLAQHFLASMLDFPQVQYIGTTNLQKRMAVLSFNFIDYDNAQISHKLSANFGITNRCGLHCAPFAHKTLHTYPQGTVRFSFSHFNTLQEIDLALKAVKECLKK